MIAKIATGEIDERTEATKAAAMLGKQGGKARAASLTARQRSEIAKLAAEARWKKGDS
ncbi:MAG TPA: RNA-binding protein [Nitrobacter sp.]|nr:RNA-binding protein [Nitrobacter sp.]